MESQALKVQIINGPNLNLLGVREPHIYGNTTLEAMMETIRSTFPSISIEAYQTNHEGGMIDLIQSSGTNFDGLIINPGAFSHYSYAILDALLAIQIIKIEVHLTNIYQRETFRQHSVTAAGCHGLITGLGKTGYLLAVRAIEAIFFD